MTISLPDFLSDSLQQILLKGLPDQSKLHTLLLAVAEAVKDISKIVAKGSIADLAASINNQNMQGEMHMKLDVISNQVFIDCLVQTDLVQGVVSEELASPHVFSAGTTAKPFLVILNPLDGATNIAINGIFGSIFSVLKAPLDRMTEATDFLQPGKQQIAAGYALYGPATMLIFTLGNGTHGFTLDSDSNLFILTHPNLIIAKDAAEFAINTSNTRFWEPPITRYINECNDGKHGARKKDFNMRWTGSMVADLHRVLMRSGIYLYPGDTKISNITGRLKLLYEANPMGMLVEQAGGIASTGRLRLLHIEPKDIHQRISVVMGSKKEVLRVERYHHVFDSAR